MSVRVALVSKVKMKRLISTGMEGMISIEGKEILLNAVKNSEVIWLGEDDDVPLGFFGLIPPTLMSDTAYLWLYALPTLLEHKFILVRHSQRAVEEMLKHYPIIVGHGRSDDGRSLRWLRWLGARFKEPQGPVIPFEINAHSFRLRLLAA